ncbi:putative solute carrier organic anion transporter family member 4A1 [Apostichopus japonicus]|uniref:Putative solute carrier organic anion transporter family member 4A1 n=1 Tax=Stichopus japonicus TaxID=307972 RepID=A0A2G8K4L3_STIJA|nr:putative solute carrier organic anion transporter family member 4A1 [Apostichopus japonicus]
MERQRQNNAQKGSGFQEKDGVAGKVKDFPRALWNLLTNVPYMCLCMASSAENFMVSCVAVFGPKFMESVYTLTAGEAALLTGLVVIPSSLGGCVLGGYVIKRFNWQYRGRIKFAIGSLVISWFLLPAVFIQCPGLRFAGVTVDYSGTTNLELGESNITSACNFGCSCTDDYDPVCASTNVMYYSACHAGCAQQDDSGVTTKYSECLCVPGGDGSFGGTAVEGKCYEECNSLGWFAVLAFFMLFFAMASIVPNVTGIFEVVDISQRTTSLGLQSLFYRCLGTIPGPIVFGLLIDKSCMIWEDDCDDVRTCWLYENDQFALYLFLILIVFRTLSITFFTAAYFTYKPVTKKGEENGDEIKEPADVAMATKEIGMETDDTEKVDNRV